MISAEWLLVLLLMLPAIGVLAIVAAGEKRAEPVALSAIAATCLVVVVTVARVLSNWEPQATALGGYLPPLGLSLRADGASVVLLTVAAVVMAAVGWFAVQSFRRETGPAGVGGRTPFLFWCFLLAVWVALNAVCHWSGSVQPLCRAGAADLRRCAARLPRRAAGDARRSAALPAVRAARLRALSARHRMLYGDMARWISPLLSGRVRGRAGPGWRWR